MSDRRSREPFAARLHFVPRLLRNVQAAIVRALRSYFENAPGWTLLVTRGRRTGLPREVLLPCARGKDTVVVISTYGGRSDWMKNLCKEPRVSLTWSGRVLSGHAEIIEDVERKRQIVTEHPFFPPAPFVVLNTLLRPLLGPSLRRWVAPRPIVVIHCSSE